MVFKSSKFKGQFLCTVVATSKAINGLTDTLPPNYMKGIITMGKVTTNMSPHLPMSTF